MLLLIVPTVGRCSASLGCSCLSIFCYLSSVAGLVCLVCCSHSTGILIWFEINSLGLKVIIGLFLSWLVRFWGCRFGFWGLSWFWSFCPFGLPGLYTFIKSWSISFVGNIRFAAALSKYLRIWAPYSPVSNIVQLGWCSRWLLSFAGDSSKACFWLFHWQI